MPRFGVLEVYLLTLDSFFQLFHASFQSKSESSSDDDVSWRKAAKFPGETRSEMSKEFSTAGARFTVRGETFFLEGRLDKRSVNLVSCRFGEPLLAVVFFRSSRCMALFKSSLCIGFSAFAGSHALASSGHMLASSVPASGKSVAVLEDDRLDEAGCLDEDTCFGSLLSGGLGGLGGLPTDRFILRASSSCSFSFSCSSLTTCLWRLFRPSFAAPSFALSVLIFASLCRGTIKLSELHLYQQKGKALYTNLL